MSRDLLFFFPFGYRYMQMYTGVARVVRAVSSRVVKTASRIVQIFDHSCQTMFFLFFEGSGPVCVKKKGIQRGVGAGCCARQMQACSKLRFGR